MYVIGWETRFYGFSHWRSHLKKQSRDPDVVRRVQNDTYQTLVAKFSTINAFFVIANKSSVPAIVPERSTSASFVTLEEIHNVDVPVASNRNATADDFEIESDLGSNSYT